MSVPNVQAEGQEAAKEKGECMSDTIIDMPKVTQMLDAGWRVMVFKNPLGSYTAQAFHDNFGVMAQTRSKLIKTVQGKGAERYGDVSAHVDDCHFNGNWLMTDDFTPEQALTRLAYKAVGGEIL